MPVRAASFSQGGFRCVHRSSGGTTGLDDHGARLHVDVHADGCVGLPEEAGTVTVCAIWVALGWPSISTAGPHVGGQ